MQSKQISTLTRKTKSQLIRRGLSLYMQPNGKGRGSPYWYARVYMRIGGKTLHVKSTRTTDLSEATRRAEEFWADLAIQRRLAERGMLSKSETPSVTKGRFDRAMDDWLDGLKADAGTDKRRLRAFEDARKLCTAPNGLGAFFGRMDVGEITTGTIRDYLRFAVEKSRKGKLASTTKRNHLTTFKAILKFAVEQRLIASVPPFPRVRVKDNPRSWFEPREYRILWRCAGGLRRHANLAGDYKAAEEWRELRDFIIFMVGTFLRPSEWKDLRQRDVRIVGGQHPYLQLTVANGKTRPRTVVSMPSVIRIYEGILKRDGIDPDRYIFKAQYRNRTTAYERMRDSFEKLLDETGLAYDRFGRKRVIYSLRHTALMLRLLNGDNVDHLMLARNAGTSVNQLERFYLSHIEPTMKVANLQSFRAVPSGIVSNRTRDAFVGRGNLSLSASLLEPPSDPVPPT